MPAACRSRTRCAIASAPSGASRSTDVVGDQLDRALPVSRLPGRFDVGQVRDRAGERVAVRRDARVLHHVAAHPLPGGVDVGPGVAEERGHDQQLVGIAAGAPGTVPDELDPLGGLLRRAPGEERAVGELAGEPDHARAHRSDDDGDPRALRQRRPEAPRADVLPVERRASRRRAPAGTPAGTPSRTRAAARTRARASARSRSGSRRPRPRSRGPGASEASVWNPIASSPTGRVDIGTTPVPIETRSVATAIADEQREDVGARDLAGDDRVVPTALGLARELHEPLDREAPPRPVSRRRRAPGQRPSNDGGRRSRNAATPSLWSAVVKSRAVVSSVSASPRPVSRFTNCFPIRTAIAGLAAIRPAIASASSSSCVVRHDGLDEADLERLLGVDDVGREREPARPVAADHVGPAHEAVARLEADRRLAEREGGALGGDDDVAGQDDLGAAAVGDAVHGRHDRQLGPLDGVEGVEDEPQVPPVGGQVAKLVERGDVAAGGERVACAGEDERADVRRRAPRLGEHERQLAEERRGHGVLLLGPVHPDDGHGLSALDAENLELASRPSVSSLWRKTSLTVERLVEKYSGALQADPARRRHGPRAATAATLAVGGVLLRRKPIAFLSALAERGAARTSALYTFLASLDVDLLVARGAVAEVHAGLRRLRAARLRARVRAGRRSG